jgi:hypothetical protein
MRKGKNSENDKRLFVQKWDPRVWIYAKLCQSIIDTCHFSDNCHCGIFGYSDSGLIVAYKNRKHHVSEVLPAN